MSISFKNMKDLIAKGALDELAKKAGLTSEKLLEIEQSFKSDAEILRSARVLGQQDTQELENLARQQAQNIQDQRQRPMNVMPSDPQKMANLQNIKQALNTDSALDNIAVMRMQEQQPTMQAKAGTEGMTVSFGNGRVPGEGHGMQDNVQMPIVQKGKKVATLAVSPDEYIVDAHTMSALGNGSADAGADVMDKVVKEIRQKAFGTTKQPKQINGLASLRSAIG